ncbi:MAG: CheR family methyltransferase [Verrucomicrobiae bacterium]|nr:CheR family methyltransferase [Verrucomicrobiae bacterium]
MNAGFHTSSTGDEVNPEDFAYLQELIYRESLVVIEASKAYLIHCRLSHLARVEGFKDITEMVRSLRGNRINGLHYRVVDAMTTNETYFFRDVHPFEVLRQEVLPELIRRRQDSRRLVIWSAACATGQEPYSLAMLIREHFPGLLDWNLRILASDLSRRVLGQAREGVYNQIEINRGLPVAHLIKYFKKESNLWRLRDEIRRMVEFFECNLSAPFYDVPRADLILIRNVLIYFDVQDKRKVLGKMRRHMAPDGVLLMGATETTLNVDEEFERVPAPKCSYYRIRQR